MLISRHQAGAVRLLINLARRHLREFAEVQSFLVIFGPVTAGYRLRVSGRFNPSAASGGKERAARKPRDATRQPFRATTMKSWE